MAQLTPSTALAIINTISNLALIIAIGQGIAIAWWRKALIGSTVEELHKSWEFGTSTLSLATAGKSFNFIALAALAAKLALVDNVLLQRAAGNEPGTLRRPVDNLRLPVVDNLPVDFLGRFDDEDKGIGYLSNAFSGILGDYFASTGIISIDALPRSPYGFEWNTQCSGTCETHVEAFGFNVTCSQEEIKNFNITIDSARDNIPFLNGTNFTGPADDSTLLRLYAYPVAADEPSLDWNTNKNLSYPEPWISLFVDYAEVAPGLTAEDLYSPENGTSTLKSSRCSLRPAVVSYPIALTNITDKNSYAVNGINITNYDEADKDHIMSLDRGELKDGQMWAKKVVRPLYLHEDDKDKYYHNIYTIAHVLQKTFAASVSIQYLEGVGFVNTPADGSISQWSVHGPQSDDFPRVANLGANDPVPFLVNQLNHLMLRASIRAAIAGDETRKVASNLKGYMTINTVRYRSDYRFMVAALTVMFVCILAVLPAYYGFWQLGRKVTLGPMEIASAFRAPVLDHPKVAAAGEVDVLIQEVGSRQVRYGEVQGTGTLGVAEPGAVNKL